MEQTIIRRDRIKTNLSMEDFKKGEWLKNFDLAPNEELVYSPKGTMTIKKFTVQKVDVK